jgi:hypothetical protein
VTAREDEHLFDLRTDPGEEQDLGLERPEVLMELRGKFSEWERKMLRPIPLNAGDALR